MNPIITVCVCVPRCCLLPCRAEIPWDDDGNGVSFWAAGPWLEGCSVGAPDNEVLQQRRAAAFGLASERLGERTRDLDDEGAMWGEAVDGGGGEVECGRNHVPPHVAA